MPVIVGEARLGVDAESRGARERIGRDNDARDPGVASESFPHPLTLGLADGTHCRQ